MTQAGDGWQRPQREPRWATQTLATLPASRPRASPMPTHRNPGDSSTARCPGEFIQRATVRRGCASHPVWYASVSPAERNAPATSMLEPWPKKSCRSIFRAYSPDERFRLSDSRSGARRFAPTTWVPRSSPAGCRRRFGDSPARFIRSVPRIEALVARYRSVDSAQSFPALEQKVLERWRERDVFHESIRRREGAPPFIFYEGPPTANGRPGSHHVLSRVFKDVFPRYKTMRGHWVPRKAGWDCHGLPVEIEIKKELGFKTKHDIERYGVAEFNAKCRESVLRYIDEWNELTERIGFWIDTGDAYFTLANDYIESVWWSLKEVWEKGLLTEGHRVVPYCPRCGTALSSHEVALGYEDTVDPSVYVKFPLRDDPSVSLLAWTTMPWTLVPHAAIAVDPEVAYVRARFNGDRLILAEALVERVLGEDAEIEERMPGSALLGMRYEAPFPYLTDYGPRGHTVLPGDFVSIEDGTGVVHTGAAFGEDDFRLATDNGVTIHNPVRPDATFDERTGPFAGMNVRDADPLIVEALRESGRLFRAGEYEHAYPHCWRCDTPLIYYAKTRWYVRTTEVKDELIAANETIDWHPDHIKHGRFGKWLENNVDWALSRERYWGTPLPIWRCEGDGSHVFCVGSLDDIREG